MAVTEPAGNPNAHVPGMPIITVIGDGQLARMMQTEAIELGQSIRLLAGSKESSAAQVAADVVLGDYTDLQDLRAAVKGASVVTFDHEHVPTGHLHQLISEGVNVQPGPDALVNAQDKLVMREKLRAIGVPVPPFAAIDSVADARAFARTVDNAVCLKARRGGYDGHGVWFPDPEKLDSLVAELIDAGTPLLAEKKILLVRELSAMVARRPSGQVQPWPVVESVQTDGICTEAVAPAPDLSPELAEQAQQLAVTIAEELGVTGVLAVELFEYRDENAKPAIAVNELAMRPHNTGHWTQNGCVTSQFEQHLRAVLDWPLGSVAQTNPVTVMSNVLGGQTDPEKPMAERMIDVYARFPAAKIHMYGKTYRAGRKIGHVNLSGEELARVRREAHLAADYLVTARWADGYPA